MIPDPDGTQIKKRYTYKPVERQHQEAIKLAFTKKYSQAANNKQ